MLIEALKPLTYRWPGGEVHLAPGFPVDLPESRALRLLTRAAGKVRLVEGSPTEDQFLSQYRDVLRRWWAGDALAVKEHRRNPDWPEIHQELTRLQDELGFDKARDLRMKWAQEWHGETGICPHCGEPGTYHDPYGKNVE